jgi:diguanylate cyclase (GGDEF)-like protein/PAS domain S-box-containing protein
MKSIKQAVLDKQIDLLFTYSTLVVASGIGVTCFAWLYYAFVIDSPWLVAWGVSLIALNGFRLVLFRGFSKINQSQAKLGIWLRRHLVTTFMSGLIWGLLSLAYDPSWSTIDQVMLIMVLTGLATVSITAYAAVLEVYVVFLIPLLLPLAIGLFYKGVLETSLLGVMLMFFAIAMLFSAKQFYQQLIESIHLSFEHKFLQKELSTGSQHLESVVHALKAAEQQIDNVMETSLDGFWELNVEKNDLYLSQRWKEQLGYYDSELDSDIDTWKSLLHPDDRKKILNKLDEYLCYPSGYWEEEFRLLHKDGRYRSIQSRATPTLDKEGKLTRLTGVNIDVTDRVKAENRIKKLAYYDRITKLPNRLLFSDRVNHAIAQCKHTENKICILSLDLDQFKNINDSFGHPVGDEVLKIVSRRMKHIVRERDTLARLGGDEFAVLMENIHHTHSAAIMAGKIQSSIDKKFEVQGHDFYITTSIGISFFPDDGVDATTLLKNADTAMYKAKKVERGGFQFYTQELSKKAYQHFRIESGLRQALKKDQFFVLYQPKVELTTGRIKGVEALIRWAHPKLGEIPPEKFIPIAEESGLIRSVGEWVLLHACQAAKRWFSQGYDFGRIAVNLSGVQIQNEKLKETIDRVLKQTGLPIDLLELEVTENTLMRDAKESARCLADLQEMGVNIAIDDFGTGYSSLAQLISLPVDKLKIDRSFVKNISDDVQSAEISRTIIALGHALNKTIIAEGIEHPDQLEILRSEGCDEGQGFLFSRPIGDDQMLQLLEQKKNKSDATANEQSSIVHEF